jgi:fumarylacetoacetase
VSSSWVEIAADSHFPLQNLPLGVGRVHKEPSALLVRVGDFAINCEQLRQAGLLGDDFERPLVDLTSLDGAGARALRVRLRSILSSPDASTSELSSSRSDRRLVGEKTGHTEPFRTANRQPPTANPLGKLLTPIGEVEMQLPCRIPAFVDFYSGIHHAGNVGRMFRPDMPPLLPNYRHLPVGYNGRASTVVVSGSTISRPKGQLKEANADSPVFAPTRELDFELEVGFFLAGGSEMGSSIAIDDAEAHMHGLVLVNDWSARDMQRWEYQPLGPFLAKSFATSISPWVVPLDALEPFRVRASQDPAPLPHLLGSVPGLFDLRLDISLKTRKMSSPQIVSRSNTRYLYWSFAQQLAHQTSNGTRVEAGDLYASGTISGPDPGSYGSLLEATWRGQNPITLQETGETRTFLQDGDVVTFSGYGQGDGYRVGFGELSGEVIG